MRVLLLLVISLTLCAVSRSAAAADTWQSFGFDGNSYVKNSDSAPILVRDGYLPVPAGVAAPQEDRLPERTGAVALLCFLQKSGGKLRAEPGVAPMAGAAVTVSGKNLTIAARTDDSGYLILALPPGSYDFRLRGFSKRVKVESGKTALAAMRGGKRMVD